MLGDFSGKFWFKTKSVSDKVKLGQYFFFKYFITGLHVCQIQVCYHIGKQRQEFVPNIMPEKQDAVRTFTLKPGTINNIGVTL